MHLRTFGWKANKELESNPLSNDTFTGGLITLEGQISLNSLNTRSSSTKKHNLEALFLKHNHTLGTTLSVREFKMLLCFGFNIKHPASQNKHIPNQIAQCSGIFIAPANAKSLWWRARWPQPPLMWSRLPFSRQNRAHLHPVLPLLHLSEQRNCMVWLSKESTHAAHARR